MASPRKSKDPLAVIQARADALHRKAWGKPWPHQRSESISKAEIVPAGDGSPQAMAIKDIDDAGYAYGSGPDIFYIPDELSYTCFEEMETVARALRSNGNITDTLVVRNEYKLLHKALETGYLSNKRGIVVTGQPGIGKTTFLLYLLLRRLECKQATAVQFSPDYYFIFDEYGGTTCSLTEVDERLARCWALVDSDAYVIQPCATFQVDAHRVIQASSPKPERWKEWLKQKRGTHVISALPTVLEIAAILKELGYDPARTLSLVCKWGPSTRTILTIMESDSLTTTEEDLTGQARQAALDICSDPSSVSNLSRKLQMPGSLGSSLLFIRPYRELEENDTKLVRSGQAIPLIPTKHLAEIFEEQRAEVSNEKSLQLFYAFSSHSFTRSSAGWIHEKKMHELLLSGGTQVCIFRDGEKELIPSSTHLLSGTLTGLKSVGRSNSFYWIPSVANFEGIDGVLGDTDGNIYTVQATIARDHSSPKGGLKKVWENLHPDIRTIRRWHFVVVANDLEVADNYVKQFSEELGDFKLGRAGKRVTVWGCVHSQSSG